MKGVILVLAIAGLAVAQTPTGAIEGIVRDQAGAVVAGVQVNVVSTENGLSRSAVSSDAGSYVFAVLSAGGYKVSVTLPGFKDVVRPVTVEAGVTTQADVSLAVGNVTESITVDGAVPQIRYDSHTVGGTITRDQIENLPFNGRNALELAKLNPGVLQPTRASSNRLFVSTLGGPGPQNGSKTRVTLDGGSIMALGNGGSALGLSQDAVQEFQVAIANFDLSTGPTFSGAINVVTRSGGNDVHGSLFYFFRDHQLAAYPALGPRDANPDPFFQRRQFGFALGGPIRRDRFFFFGAWERNEQRGVGTTVFNDPAYLSLNRITASPFYGDQSTIRFDGRFSNTHSAFLRYSHDGSHAFGPPTTPQNAYPSAWTRQEGWSDQSVLGVTSALPTLVNDFRFSYFFASANQLPAREEECAGCLGIGAPLINVSSGPYLGGGDVTLNVGRRFHLSDSVTRPTGNHRIRFGVDWEHNRGGPLTISNEPATLMLFSPETAQQKGLPTPALFRTLEDFLALPVMRYTVSAGDPNVPQANGDRVRNWNTAQLFFHDTWRLRPNVSVNYGLGWSVDRNLNYDLSKPRLLAPLLGEDGLGPTRKEWTNFAPTFGLAWTPSTDGKTVVRGGGGLFYDFFQTGNLDAERTALGPPGLGRQTRDKTFTEPTSYTGSSLIQELPEIRESLLQSVGNQDLSVQQIQTTKSTTTGLNGSDVPRPSGLHVNAGVQRRITRDFVVSADVVYRHFRHLGFTSIDANHYTSKQGPVIPKCTSSQDKDPQAICSNGPIQVNSSIGDATYRGLLVRAERRFSRGLQFLGSWAWSRNTGTSSSNGFNLNNWLENRGPVPFDLTHIVNVSGVKRLPWRFDLGLNFSYSSVPPFTAFVPADLNGDGTRNDLLPGTNYNAFNRGLERDDLVRLVAAFNPTLTLPEHYELGDNFHSLDLRLSRSFPFKDRGGVTVIADGFNVYNAANLSGHRGDVTSAMFGQPNARFTQLFGSGGPRAFQLAIKVTF